MGTQSWQTPALAATIDKTYRAIEHQPELLLEHDGGPYGMTADIYVARLIGFDDQVDHEWRIPRVEPELLSPIPVRLSVSLREARYVLQSNYATARIAGEYVTPLVPWQPTVTLLCLRYRRR